MLLSLKYNRIGRHYFSSFYSARIFSLTISLCINIKKREFTEWKFSTVLSKKEVLGCKEGVYFKFKDNR